LHRDDDSSLTASIYHTHPDWSRGVYPPKSLEKVPPQLKVRRRRRTKRGRRRWGREWGGGIFLPSRL